MNECSLCVFGSGDALYEEFCQELESHTALPVERKAEIEDIKSPYFVLDLIEEENIEERAFDFLKVLSKAMQDTSRISAVVLLKSGGSYKQECYSYLVIGMCKSFAKENAKNGCSLNIVEYKTRDAEALADITAFFISKRFYMTGQVLRPDFSRPRFKADNTNKVAFVTGSGQGIGLATLKELSSLGFNVCLNDIFKSENVKQALEKTGAFEAIGDISSEKNAVSLVNSIVERYGRIDVFVANAAYMRMCPFERLEKSEFNRHISVNVKGHLKLLELIIPVMKQNGGGRIILFSSMFGTSGWKNAVSYAGTKTAMIGLGQYLSKELYGSGISVSIISPGVIDTPQLKADADDMGVDIEEIKRIYEQDIPAAKVGKPSQVAYLAGFLANGGADYLSGQILQTNGGEVTSTPELII